MSKSAAVRGGASRRADFCKLRGDLLQSQFENARRGLIGKPKSLVVTNAKGGVVWDLDSYTSFIGIDRPAPDTVNPSLWRNAQLNVQY